MSRKDRKELKKGKGQKREKTVSTPMQLRRLMEKELEPKRYQHTLGVAYTAAALAMRYGADIQKSTAQRVKRSLQPENAGRIGYIEIK